MRLILKICKVLVALFIMLSAGYLLSYSNLIESAKGMGKRTPKITITCLGSVPMEASLAHLGLKKDKTMIELKERWLDSQTDPHAYDRIAVSPNGKFHVCKTFPAGEKLEGGVIATFIDSNGAEIWSSEVGEDILVSNNGKNIVAFSSAFGTGNLTLHDVRGSTEPIAVIPNYGVNTFTENGDYFMSSGSKIALYTADGHLLWEKDSGARAVGKVVVSPDANFIVLSSKSLLGELEPKAGKIHLSFFKGDSILVGRTSLNYRIAQRLAISRNGKYTAMSCDSTLLFFQNDSAALLWKYEFPNVYWMVTSIAISGHGDIIALGIISNRGDRLSPRYLYVLSKAGEKIADFRLEKPSVPQIGPIVVFSEDEKYILAGTKMNKYCFEISNVK